MRPHTESIPKALISVGGTPFADLQLRWLAEAGVTEVIYSIGYRGQLLRDHVGDGAKHGLKVEYVDEDDNLRGTAGALRFALSQDRLPNSFHVLYGDSYLTLDLSQVEAAWHSSGHLAQMTVLQNRGRWDRSNVIFELGKVVLYEPDPNRMAWIGSTMDSRR
jgi:NDP-sugar pyrophosphorylase family protein